MDVGGYDALIISDQTPVDIPKLPIDPDVATPVDLHDGSLDDWREQFGEPTFTQDDFISLDVGAGAAVEPFEMYLVWDSEANRIYLAIEREGDAHVTDDNSWATNEEGTPVGLGIDGIEVSVTIEAIGNQPLMYVATADQGQGFNWFFTEVVDDMPVPFAFNWFFTEVIDDMPVPFVAVGGANYGETTVTEMAFELPIDPDVIMPLEAGQIIGLLISVVDYDEAGGELQGFHSLFVDAHLIEEAPAAKRVGTGVNNRIETSHWGMIKERISR